MAVDAGALLVALQQAGLPVRGLNLPDVTDPTTCIFQPDLSPSDRARAVTLLQALVFPPQLPPPTIGLTLDQVIAWQAGKLGMSVAQARTEIGLLPVVYSPPILGPGV